jgi:hypothetical protein
MIGQTMSKNNHQKNLPFRQGTFPFFTGSGSCCRQSLGHFKNIQKIVNIIQHQSTSVNISQHQSTSVNSLSFKEGESSGNIVVILW